MDGCGSRVSSLERCLLGQEELLLPGNFIEQSSLFNEVVSLDTWENVLTESQRQHLLGFLPSYPSDDEAQKQTTIQKLFGGENFKFGNPVKQFHTKLREGCFSADVARYASLCRKFKHRDYKLQQQRHYSKLLQEILLSRQRVLELLNHLPPDELPKFSYTVPQSVNHSIEQRVKRRYFRIVREVREECGVDDTSSEEEDLSAVGQKSRKQLLKSLYPLPSPEPAVPSVMATFSTKRITNGEVAEDGNCHGKKQRRSLSPVEIVEEDYKNMLKDYKRRKVENKDQPEFDISNITLQDILVHCQAGRKTASKSTNSISNGSHSVPNLKKTKKKGEKLKVSRPDGSVKHVSPSNGTSLEIHEGLIQRDDECVLDFPLTEALPPKLSYGQFDNFFSLLRDLICEFPEAKVTTAKLEEKVREWQESPTSSLNTWFSHQQNWIENVVSALKFLSGDVLGVAMDNFIPFLDYKERAQQWKWIGGGRDTDDQLGKFCKYWLQNKDETMADVLDSNQGSPPPPRIKTNYVVRPTTESEKVSFRDQEKQRFTNPHRAFTYRLHGYESVVGPVKGVYSKENAMNKAREHALLISDRPAYVTILTLVRDAAARLPNGEGTRGDICELLKDSQFLAPGVTDTQINTVVSGALDRLHYEKDPCVKYDVNRKLWIYLHRNRTEEEFERIHQAQGAAVKAKKSLQKPKATKTKTKEGVQVSTIQAPACSPRPPSSLSIASNDSINIDEPAVQNLASPILAQSPKPPAQSPRISTSSPRALQNSPKPPISSSKAATISLNLTQAAVGSAPAAAITTTAAGSTVASVPLSEIAKPLMQVAGAQSQPAVLTSSALSKPLTFAIVPSQVGTCSAPSVVTQVRPATSKPLPLNLFPGHIVTKAGGGPVSTASLQQATHTVVITSKPELLLPRQQSGVALAQQQLSSTCAAVTITGNKSLMGQAPILATAKHASIPTVSTATPVVARLVSGSQMVSVGNLLPGSTQKAQVGSQGPTTIKIQGSNILQPVVTCGKPVHITGKTVQAAKGILQIGGKPHQSVGMIQTTQGTLSTINIIPPANAVSQSKTSASTVTADSGAATVLSSALQSVATISQLKNVTSGHNSVVTAGSTLLTQQPLQMVSQPKVVSPGQAGIVVTHLTPGGITLRPGLSAGSQAKVVSAAQAGLVPAQFILHQPHTTGIKVAGSDTSVTPTVTQATPIILNSTGGKPAQNIQVVRTVLSQPSVKPGQTTILISQPTLQQSGAPVLSSAQLLHTTAKIQGKGAAKGKPPPLYARIITPPAGMKIATMGPGQGVSVIQAAGKVVPAPVSAVTAAQLMTTAKLLETSGDEPK